MTARIALLMTLCFSPAVALADWAPEPIPVFHNCENEAMDYADLGSRCTTDTIDEGRCEECRADGGVGDGGGSGDTCLVCVASEWDDGSTDGCSVSAVSGNRRAAEVGVVVLVISFVAWRLRRRRS